MASLVYVEFYHVKNTYQTLMTDQIGVDLLPKEGQEVRVRMGVNSDDPYFVGTVERVVPVAHSPTVSIAKHTRQPSSVWGMEIHFGLMTTGKR